MSWLSDIFGGGDRIRQALREGAVVIDPGVSEIFVREGGEALCRSIGSKRAGLDCGEKFEERCLVHG